MHLLLHARTPRKQLPLSKTKMPSSKTPRKKYKPRGQFANPLGYVLEGMTPVRAHDEFLRTLKIRNSAAMLALLQGCATQADMTTLVDMSNIVETLCSMEFGAEYRAISVEGRTAILNIIFRAVDKLRFIPTGPEIGALQALLELHDQQLEIITVKELDAAIALAKQRLKLPTAIRLPNVKTKAETAERQA
jgi:hypothetical protein